MKRLTKYKDGKFLLNHSSMNKAIDKLGKLEIVYEMNKNKDYYEKNEGEIYRNANEFYNNISFYLSENGEAIKVTYSDGLEETDGFEETLYFKDYKKNWALNKGDLENEI